MNKSIKVTKIMTKDESKDLRHGLGGRKKLVAAEETKWKMI